MECSHCAKSRRIDITGRYEIRDGNYPNERGQRYTKLENAQRELAHAVGAPGRFYIFDRQEKKKVST